MACSLFVKGLNGFEGKVHGIGARVLGGKASCELCWLAQGKYVCTDIPAPTKNRKAHFHSYQEDVSKAELVIEKIGGLRCEHVFVFRKPRLHLVSL